MKYIDTMQVNIMDRRYSIFFCSEKQYKKVAPEGSRAFVSLNNRCVYFNCEDLLPHDTVAIHEVTHIYCAELLAHDLSFKDPGEHEEHFCSVMERRGADILAKAKPITKRLMAIRAKLARKVRTNEGK